MRCEYRTRRRDPGGTRVTTEDALLLRFVGAAAPTTSRALARLVARPLPRIYHRVRVLHAHGLLARTVVSINEPDRLSLTSSGRQFVAQKFGLDPDAIREVRVAERDYRHHDAVVDVALTLTRACARSQAWTLSAFLFEREIRRELGAPEGALVPDGFARLQHADGAEVGLVVEADTGSCDPKWVAKHKLLAYADAHLGGQAIFGIVSWRVCLVAPSFPRVAHLATAAWRAGVPEGLVAFAVTGALPEERVLRDGWQTFRGVEGTEDFALTTERVLPVPNTKPEHGVRAFGVVGVQNDSAFQASAGGRSAAGEDA